MNIEPTHDSDLATRNADIARAARQYLIEHSLSVVMDNGRFYVYEHTWGAGASAIADADTRAEAYELALHIAASPEWRPS